MTTAMILRGIRRWNEHNSSRLFEVSANGDTDEVRVFVTLLGNPNWISGTGRTALTVASEGGHSETVEMLTHRGAYVNAADANGAAALHYAAEAGRLEVARVLLDASAFVDVHDVSAQTPLYRAALAGQREMVRLLIQKGAHVESRDEWRGDCPLHCAVEAACVDIVRLLLAAGADVNAGDRYGWTPLHRAALEGDMEIIGLLLDNGAATSHRDGYGWLAASLASTPEALELLAPQGCENVKVSTMVANGESGAALGSPHGPTRRVTLPGESTTSFHFGDGVPRRGVASKAVVVQGGRKVAEAKVTSFRNGADDSWDLEVVETHFGQADSILYEGKLVFRLAKWCARAVEERTIRGRKAFNVFREWHVRVN